MRRSSFAAALLFALSACGRTGSRRSDEKPSNSAGSSNVSPTDGGAGGRAAEPEPLDCEHPHPGAAPLSMLTNDELRRSLQELLGKAEQTERLPPEDDSASLTERLVSVMHDIAHATAQAVVTDAARLAAVLDCDPATGAEACRAHFIERFLRQAFRRPATPEERAQMGNVFQRGQELGGNFDGGVRAVIEVTLQSPEFLYLLEFGSGPVEDGVVTLAPFEMAARLSYFLTGGPPDADLFEAAEQGRLQEGNGLEEQLRRLVGSPANREHVVSFYRQIYRLHNDGSAEVPVSNELLAFAREETRLFIEDATFDIGTYRALLTEPTTWLNEPLARFYGYENVTGAEFRKVELDPAKRAGLFTQQAFLDASSFTNRPGTIQRGYFVLNQLLCLNMPPDPPPVGPIEPPDPQPGGTWREQLMAFTSDASCAGCHEHLNAAGFAFEHYDGVGRYRTLDAGQPIDASGTLSATDAAGAFQDATQLLPLIANSKDGQACFVSHWQKHAYRRQLDMEDSCVTAELARSFQESDGNVVQLMLTLAQSDRFRYRLESELR
jgi:hypothetical protein